MCSSIDSFKDLSEKQKGKVANGDSVFSTGGGNISIDLKTRKISEISDVLCVPELKTNLLSVSAMINKGFTVLFDTDGCKIFDEVDNKLKGDIVATATQVSGVYKLDINKTDCSVGTEQFFLVNAEESEMIWHQRLGHLNRVSLNLLKNGLATGIKFSGDAKDESDCIPCILGKQSRNPFPRNKNKRLPKNVLDLIHTDLCGPMPVSSWSNKRYMSTFIDDHSRMIFGYFLNSKEEVKSCVVDFINMVELECERKVKS